jgi:hypothetical protein
MKTFRDDVNRLWSLDIDPAAVSRVRLADGFDLDDLAGLRVVLADEERLLGVLFMLCADQAEEYRLSREDFLSAMRSGDTTARAIEALAWEIVATNPDPLAWEAMGRELRAAKELARRDARQKQRARRPKI